MKELNSKIKDYASKPTAKTGVTPPRFGLTICLLAALAAGLAVSGCSKKEAVDPNASPSVTGKATPREYIVNGQIDLQAVTQSLREYVIWKGTIPTDINVMVTSGFVTNLPKPPAGKKYFINRGPMMYEVILINQ